MIKLTPTPTQKTVLELSANNANGHIVMPENIRGGAVDMVLQGLITKGFAEFKGNNHIITSAGLQVIGFESVEKSLRRIYKNPKLGTKQDIIIQLLKRSEGATLEQMVEATCWQKHTVRGTLSGVLKKRLGYFIESAKNTDNVRIYRIIEA
jgi:hypothetical protein